MVNKASNHFKYLLAAKEVDLVNDAFKIILMETGFTFDEDAHALYADVVGSELPTLNGYVQFTKGLVKTGAPDEDDVNNRCNLDFNAVSWTASGGPIGPSCGAIVLDDTIANDPVVGFIDFGGDYTQADGGIASLSSISIRVK